jgi:ABC-type sugar transport system ATPase subunit
MGENGAGKSTLMKIAAGLIDDFKGEIAVDGSRVSLTLHAATVALR